MRRVIASLALIPSFACSSDEASAPDAGPIDDASPLVDAIDRSDELFAPGRILEVELELPEASWDALRSQTRNLLSVLSGDCLAEPFPSPFTYFEGTATLDGVTFERVGIRKKGFIGSLSADKPSLKVKLDEYLADRDHQGIETFTFNNSQQDPSYVRQCVSYDIFRKAGVPAPRCSFAHVTVNGRDLGLYVHVESLNKQFIQRHFTDDSGNLYEGTLSDFRPEFVNTFEAKSNEETTDRSDLQEVVEAAQLPDGQLVPALQQHIDLEGFLTFWATEVLVRHWDGYASNTNNFYVYHDPVSDQFEFIPWGTDGTLQPNPLVANQPPDSVFASGVLARRLYLAPSTQASYLERLRGLLETVWNEAEVLDSIDRMEASIRTLAAAGNPSFADAVEEVRDMVLSRRGEIESELASGPPPWTQAPTEPLCFEPLGTLDLTFSTTWGTIGNDDIFATGTGAFAATINGMPAEVTTVGSKAGWDPDSAEPRAAIQAAAQLADGSFYIAFIQVVPYAFTPGMIQHDLFTVFGGLIHWVPGGAFTLVGMFGEGTLTLDDASLEDGEPVMGQVRTEIVTWPF
jgi:spore coat protein CotH